MDTINLPPEMARVVNAVLKGEEDRPWTAKQFEEVKHKITGELLYGGTGFIQLERLMFERRTDVNVGKLASGEFYLADGIEDSAYARESMLIKIDKNKHHQLKTGDEVYLPASMPDPSAGESAKITRQTSIILTDEVLEEMKNGKEVLICAPNSHRVKTYPLLGFKEAFEECFES